MVNIVLNPVINIGTQISVRVEELTLVKDGATCGNWRFPIKVKNFIWRLCRNNVPVRKVLRSRGVQTPIMCLMCGDDVEHLLHLFLDCSFAQECWGLMGLSFDVLSIEDFQEWLLDKLTTGSKDSKVQLVTVLWTVWNARNLKVWEGKVIASSIALQWSNSHIV